MSLKPYPEYKESGFDWLGALPTGWEAQRLKFGFDLQKRPIVSGMDIVTAFRDGEVTLRRNRRLAGYTEGDKQFGYQGIEPGDLVIHAMDAFAGAIGVSDSYGKSTPVYSVCTPKSGVNARFFALALRHLALTGYIESLSKGIRERSSDFRWADAKDVIVPFPPQNEQYAIVDYLDRETADIDAFIADQEELIALLGERRTATVSAKTFPYSPGSSDTSIFPLVRIGQAFSESDDRVESASPEDLLSVSIHSGVSPWKDLHDKEPRSETLRNYKIVQPGDIVLNRMRAFQGGLGEAKTPGVVSPDYMVMHVRKSADSKYLAYLMKSPRFVAEMSSRLRGIGSEEQGTVRTPRINPRDLSNIRVPLPPVEEQRQIATYLDHEIAEIDAAIADAREAIALSKERRAAVISAAVTGKIDVRGTLAPATNKVEAESVGVA